MGKTSAANPRKNRKRKTAKKSLSIRRKRFVRELTDSKGQAFGNATKAAEAAGYKGEPGSTQLRVQGHANLTNPNVSREIERALDGAGVTRKKIGETVAAALDAKKRPSFYDREGGKVVYGEEEPDHANSLRAAELGSKLRGDIMTHRTIERRELLQIQQNILIVPLGQPNEPIEVEGEHGKAQLAPHVMPEIVRMVKDE